MTTAEQAQKIIAELRNPQGQQGPVMMNQIQEIIRANNRGYPVNLYHATEDAVVATNEQMEAALREIGYGRTYIHKHFPKFVFRRNDDPKLRDSDYIESRVVKDEQELETVKKQYRPGCSAWFESAADVPEMERPQERSAIELELARAKAELEGMKSMLAEKRGPGRPRKEDE